VEDSELFGRTVWHAGGTRMGRIEAVVHQQDGTRLAVVRRGRVFRRWYYVSLTGARRDGDRVVATAAFGRGRPARESAA
jgi:hypothetical protein